MHHNEPIGEEKGLLSFFHRLAWDPKVRSDFNENPGELFERFELTEGDQKLLAAGVIDDEFFTVMGTRLGKHLMVYQINEVLI